MDPFFWNLCEAAFYVSHTRGLMPLCSWKSVGLCVCVCVCPLLHQEGFAAMRTRMFYLCRQHVHCACYLIILVIFLCMFLFVRWDVHGESGESGCGMTWIVIQLRRGYLLYELHTWIWKRRGFLLHGTAKGHFNCVLGSCVRECQCFHCMSMTITTYSVCVQECHFSL